MKKILFIMFALVCGIAAQAQNANRSGAFVELGVGATVGDNPDQRGEITNTVGNVSDMGYGGYEFDVIQNKVVKKTSGVSLNLGGGYRWATSMSWAVEAKLLLQSHLGAFAQSLAVKVMPGVRYTSPEISGQTSIYAAVNAGIGAMVDNVAMCVPYEASVGFNFGNNISAGLVWSAQYTLSKTDVHGAHFGLAGVKVGYRF